MAELRLSNSDLTATIDDRYAAACAGRSWFLKKSSYCSYVASTVRIGHKTPTVRLHTFIIILAFGSIPVGYDVHHKDENPLNNILENLEVLEHSKHMQLTYTNNRG